MTGRSYEDDGFVIENSPLVVFQELHEDKILNINRNLFLNSRKISYVTLVDVVAHKSALKNNLDTFGEDGFDRRKKSVMSITNKQLFEQKKKRLQSVDIK